MQAAAARTALVLSPHLDDAAFSCGGLLATLAARDWRVVVATVFTRSVHPATGFALACQRDKQLPDQADYMLIRREEDRLACAALGAEQRLLDLPEAPNRGYGSAAALFAPPLPGDGIAAVLAPTLARLIDELRPTLLLAPQGCGAHVDHLLLLDALLPVLPPEVAAGFYRDTPYVIRDPDAPPAARLLAAGALRPAAVALDAAAAARRQDAVACFATQLGFQFGGAAAARAAIEALMRREAAGLGCERAERLLSRGAELPDGLAPVWPV